MSNFGDHPAGFFGVSDFYNGVATQSLRFAYTSAETWLARTPDAGNRKTHTLSVWVKRSGLSASQNILEARGSGDAGNTDIWFDANDKLEVSGASTYFRVTTQRFRDVNSWYHLVFRFDTTQGTANNRLLIYVNGSVITDFDTNNNYSQNTDYGIGGNVEHRIGDGYGHFDGYMARYEFIDGLSLGPENFGETKNGIWIAKSYGGSYGTNGHKLEFKETGTDADANGLGADTSGNNNHYTPTAILGHDSAFPDSPENNFPTFNPTFKTSTGAISWINNAVTLSEGNLRANLNTGNETQSGAFATFTVPTSGKWYWEILAIAEASGSISGTGVIEASTGTYIRSASNTSGRTYGAGDIINVAFDADNNRIFFGINGTFPADQTPTDSSDGTAAAGSDYLPYVWGNHASSANQFAANFGQDSSFAGQKTAQGNADGNGIGDFYYSPPSGFRALCSANLSEPTIGPNSATQADDYFNTVTYTGTGSSNAINTVGFQTDWLWIKRRNGATSHRFIDSSRGVDKYLSSDTSNAEDDATGIFTSFDTNGFTVEGTANSTNGNNQTYVAWNWKANGGTTSNNSDGDGASVVQANTTAGFSIVTYTGSSNESYGHGLDSAPEMIIVKGRNVAHNWAVYHQGVQNATSNGFLELNSTSATQTGSNPRFLNGTTSTSQPTNTVFNVNHYSGSSTNASNNSDTYIAYCFHSVEGYSKFGSYTGNGNADGSFIFTGFRPAWVMFKRTDGAGNSWGIKDTVRDSINPNNGYLFAESNGVEGTATSLDIDFLSNGLKFRGTSSDGNGNGNTYIYMAFAEAPFKYANAR